MTLDRCDAKRSGGSREYFMLDSQHRPSRCSMPTSLWQAAAQSVSFEPLDGDLEVDVAIVGGGITGVLCAHALADSGLRVAGLEAGRVGESSTGNSTGNLYAIVGARHGALDREAAAELYP